MTRVVISQPMFFPWVGLFEQIRLADVYVHYDDVQFSKGSFTNRVQIKTATGSKWLTVPLLEVHLGQRINEVRVDDRQDWRRRHRELLAQVYARAPYVDEMLTLVDDIYRQPAANLAVLATASMLRIISYFDLCPSTRFVTASELGIDGASSTRVLDVVKALGGTVYVTGHGALKYLDHELFDANGVRVDYIDYEKKPYPQQYGNFNPYVSTLDLVANMGVAGSGCFCSGTVPWRDFLGRPR
jgi:WbqC-like protein family